MSEDRTDIGGIADEYVLGLLDAMEARQVEADMERDPDLKAAIAASRERFLPLDDTAEPTVIDDDLWSRIDAALPVQGAAPADVSRLTANDNRPGSWRATALAAMVAAVILAVALSFNLMRTVEPLVVAVLVNEAGDIQAIVEDFGNEKAAVRLLADFTVPEGKTIEVWTLPSPERGPVSLGLIDDARSVRLDGPALPKPHDSQLYELTLEQAGGSPTGRPTGLILAKGFAKITR
ncbi:anti-sigma-K factor RskA [Rhizobium sp. PP-F2F-G38]|uniref:Anti-sigma factor n=1 Tax=Ferranicluibacter rubi TaxID=2715133 RepID=A0AA43ZD23_9HYPH|nr:anti-sigma factor [Ferranicluibacter rubi]NHT75565.1 anti-sigma factor [Ferranicluibacter rubi]PYE30899.1 anti-sigma-K factor RskA [Rhizobium sp. PP-WC-1G-195]PYE94409.1 anti-sigma-K factor RskA [Rhizobium sp. PP-F2F-G38]